MMFIMYNYLLTCIVFKAASMDCVSLKVYLLSRSAVHLNQTSVMRLHRHNFFIYGCLSKDDVSPASSVTTICTLVSKAPKTLAERERREEDVVRRRIDGVERERCSGFHLLDKGRGINQEG